MLEAVFFRLSEGKSPKKVLEDQSSKLQEILIPASEVSLKYTPKIFHGGQIAEHIQEWQKLTSYKFILQMVKVFINFFSELINLLSGV